MKHRFFYLLLLATIFIFQLESCGNMEPEDGYIDRDDRANRSSRSNRSRDREGRENPEDEDYLAQEDEDSPFEGEVSETSERINIAKPIVQRGLSKKIDFLFIIDSSRTNLKYISAPNIKDQLGTLPLALNNLDIDWRMFFTNAEFNKPSRCKKCRNGKLLFLEYNGTLIRSEYLDNEVLLSYDDSNPVSEVFVDTIEHGLIGSNTRYCSFPPFCHQSTTRRPLKVLSEFLPKAQHILREDADLIVVILTSSDERGERKSFGKEKVPTEATAIISQFQSIYSDKSLYGLSIVVKANDKTCKDESANNQYASYVPQLSILTKGLVISICPIANVNSYTTPIINFIRKKLNHHQ